MKCTGAAGPSTRVDEPKSGEGITAVQGPSALAGDGRPVGEAARCRSENVHRHAIGTLCRSDNVCRQTIRTLCRNENVCRQSIGTHFRTENVCRQSIETLCRSENVFRQSIGTLCRTENVWNSRRNGKEKSELPPTEGMARGSRGRNALERGAAVMITTGECKRAPAGSQEGRWTTLQRSFCVQKCADSAAEGRIKGGFNPFQTRYRMGSR